MHLKATACNCTICGIETHVETLYYNVFISSPLYPNIFIPLLLHHFRIEAKSIDIALFLIHPRNCFIQRRCSATSLPKR